MNISSRGLMIHTGRQIAKGTKVEVRRGEHVITARVVWRDGARAGLQAEDRVPVEAIMTCVQSPAFQLIAATGERRKRRGGMSGPDCVAGLSSLLVSSLSLLPWRVPG